MGELPRNRSIAICYDATLSYTDVDTDGKVLQRAGIHETLRVESVVVHEKHVISVRDVEEV